jgi:hypothetical protein
MMAAKTTICECGIMFRNRSKCWAAAQRMQDGSYGNVDGSIAAGHVVNVRTTSVAIVIAVGLLAVFVRRTWREESEASQPGAGVPESAPAVASALAPVVAPLARPMADVAAGAAVVARWGGRKGELGHSRDPEANAEGPMSVARAGDDLLVLDQVNGRVVRYDGAGAVRGTFEASRTTQDIAVARDGTVALLDRLVDRSVRLVGPGGNSIATIPVPSSRVPDPGLVTGLFIDKTDVYVEKEHSVLVRIGSTDGHVGDAAVLPGRPTKDGASILMAVLDSADSRVKLNVLDRTRGVLRFARAVPFPPPARQIVLLDSDLSGKIYIAVAGPELTRLACLDVDGEVAGRVDLPVSSTPDESFRDFVVADDGTITQMLRSEDGVEYRTTRCP